MRALCCPTEASEEGVCKEAGEKLVGELRPLVEEGWVAHPAEFGWKDSHGQYLSKKIPAIGDVDKVNREARRAIWDTAIADKSKDNKRLT